MCKCPEKCSAVKSFDDLCVDCLDEYAEWLAERYEDDQEHYYAEMEKMSQQGGV